MRPLAFVFIFLPLVRGRSLMNLFFSLLKKVEIFFTVLFLATFSIISFAQVVFRVFLNNPLAWSEEASIFLFIWSVFLGAVLVFSHNEHFRVDFIVNLFPPKGQMILKYINWIFVGIFSVILLIFGWRIMLINANRITPALQISQMYVYAVIPLNGLLVLLHLIEQIWNDFTGQKEKKEDA